MTVAGDEQSLQKLHREHFACGQFDYNSIISMPPELEVESGSARDTGYAALYGDWKTVAAQWMFKEPAAKFDYPWPLESREQVIACLKYFEGGEFYFAPARAFRANLDKYGYGDAFSWAEKHWGSPWNLRGDVEVLLEGGCLHLRTNLGSFPKEVFRHLSAAFPTLDFDIAYITDFDKPGRSFVLRAGREQTKHKLEPAKLREKVHTRPDGNLWTIG